MTITSPVLTLGTRGSPLALAQTDEVTRRLTAAHPGLRTLIRGITTTGDAIQDRPLAAIGGKGLFTKELDDAMMAGRIDLAVHSMKDVPTVLPDGIVLGALLEREDPRDAFIALTAKSLAELPAGAVVGSASLRRAAQVRSRYPHLRVESLRGNVQTRLRKLEDGIVDATLLAMAGLNRLGIGDRATAPLSVDEMLPAVAQGAIGITCRADDAAALALLAAIGHAETTARVACERAFLTALDGSCRTPIAGLAEISGDTLSFRGLIVRPDGSARHDIRREGRVADAAAIGQEAGEALLAQAGPGFLA